ncbi:FAD-dependent oxidoreductase [Paenibacillus sp. IB182496]|uniref:FAD-dependent oxidoreductase n=1 Tax=Paenibacillus sabuli TaxID=2772509 RepID=A0A927BRX2_9BACL|nr:FAD-dependent oxidoreductase [Paenibacillus sabuli]MBD2844555.1 FAD-dependent oxidoreductase [Paenibacillus sabuli]
MHTSPNPQETLHEQERALDVTAHYDVIVCGAGPAGIAAALAAARSGARTCLIELHGCLGGIWTAGQLAYIIDGANKTGLLPELLARLERHDARQGFVCDVEALKLELEAMCAEAGVTVRLHTRVAAAHCDAAKRLTHIVTESKSGREAWRAEVFVDATGDGDLAAQAGCGYSLGEEHSGAMQPMSLIALVAGVDPEASRPYTLIERASRLRLLADIERGGYSPSYRSPGLWHIRDELYMLMANHQYGRSGLNADDLTAATLQARREVNEVVAALRGIGGIWERLRLVSTASQIGVREGRRIHGLYTVTKEDLLSGVRHPDAVCRVTFKVDVHALHGAGSKSFESANQEYRERAQPYDIPLRALVARDVGGLVLAGRCISGDFLAHSSYRVTGNAVQTGQAAGVLAATSAAQGVLPERTDWPAVKSGLERLLAASTASAAAGG